jgi:ArsR family transcriptional regulator
LFSSRILANVPPLAYPSNGGCCCFLDVCLTLQFIYRKFTIRMKNSKCDDICRPARSPQTRSLRGDDERFAQLAQALGHPARVAIIRLLKERETCICGEIVEVLPLAQSTVSQHLKVLKDAGWIQGEVDGPRVCYCLDPDTLKMFRTLLNTL